MDIGANHGLFGLFAAVLGAQVIQLEPQKELCKVNSRCDSMRSLGLLTDARDPMYMLVGSNKHFAFFPVQVINVARALNGPEVSARITLYNYAALDAREWIKLDAQVPPLSPPPLSLHRYRSCVD